jgi:SAM-dependent methyltransferase
VESSAGIRERLLDRYLSPDGCHHYLAKYRRWRKRLAHRHECGLLDKLLGRAGRMTSLIDVPCGPARFFDVLSRHTDELHLGDVSPEMLALAREQTGDRAAGYHRINLVDDDPPPRRFECVVSIRLMHHLYSPDARSAYLNSLERLSERWVVMTFRHARAVRTLTRQFTRCFSGELFLAALTFSQLRNEMADRGFRIVASAHLSSLCSGHRYVLLERT